MARVRDRRWAQLSLGWVREGRRRVGGSIKAWEQDPDDYFKHRTERSYELAEDREH